MVQKNKLGGVTMKKKSKPVLFLLGLIFTTAGLGYLFLGLDLIPDNSMFFFGFLDDAAVMLALWVFYKRLKKKTSKKGGK